MTELDLQKTDLFGNADTAVSDIAFVPGTDRDVSPEQVAAAVREALAELASGNCRDVDLSI